MKEIDTKKIKEYCEILLAFSVCLYALGFVIVNSYFVQYGFYPEELINIKYLSASLLFLFSISIFLFGIPAVRRHKDSNKYYIDIKKFKLFVIFIYIIWVYLFGAYAFKSIYFSSLKYLLSFALGVILLIVVPFIVYTKTKNKSKCSRLILPQILFISIFFSPQFQYFIMANIFLIYVVIRTKNLIVKKNQEETKITNPLIIKSLLILITIMAIIANAAAFGFIIYPLMPRYLGGGKPLTISLLINEKKQESFKALGIEIDEQGWSSDLKLIYKGRNSIYIEAVKPIKFSCIEIRNEAIEGIQYTGGYKITYLDMLNKLFKNK